MTLLLKLIFIFMLQSEGFSFQTIYKRVGEDVILHCNIDRSSNQFYDVSWLIYRPRKAGLDQINCKKNVDQSSVRDSRMSVSSDCSLLIRNITDDDADIYVCRLGNNDAVVYLNILSISSSPSDVHGRVDITCSLKHFNESNICYENSIIWMDETGSQLSGKKNEFEVKEQTNCVSLVTIPCKQNSIIWVDESGSHLSGEGVGFEFKEQTNCVSVVTVKHQSGNNKRFTCQFVEDDKVKIDAVYVLTGIRGQTKHLYQRVGDDVLLPCRPKSSSSSCSDVDWRYREDPNAAFRTDVHNGNVDQSSARASRLSVSSDCSLLIRNITDEDAGYYVCRLGKENDVIVVLNILSISKDPPEVHPRGNGSVTLQCSLKRFDKTIPCKQNSIIWMNETGSHLSGEDVGFEFRGQTNCVSVLTVKHQSGNNKRFTCKFVKDNKVKIDAVYVLDFSDLSGHNFIIIVGAVVKVMLMFLGVVAALVYMYRRRTKGNKDQRTRTRRTTEKDDEDAL